MATYYMMSRTRRRLVMVLSNDKLNWDAEEDDEALMVETWWWLVTGASAIWWWTDGATLYAESSSELSGCVKPLVLLIFIRLNIHIFQYNLSLS